MTPPRSAGAHWVCCHLGAREHYAVPRALHRRHRLAAFVTDAWVAPGRGWSRVPGPWARRLTERFHPDLADARVRHFTAPLVAHEVAWRLRRSQAWPAVMRRNAWFGRRAVHALGGLHDAAAAGTVVFAHSYSAREVFRFAKTRGWATVLGQIDPGEEHFRIARGLGERRPEYGGIPDAPPPAYFEAWREECALADWIVVNSPWAREALVRAGIPAGKMQIVPLAYEPEGLGLAVAREYPVTFTPDRPLHVLFVGHASVTKGVPELLEAMARLSGSPVDLRLVGEVAMTVPPRFIDQPAIRWVGPVPRHEVMRHYRECDVLVFPSHSDGFGMAQVEAQAWRLPVVASPHCGQVIHDGVTGLLLPEVTTEAIADALRRLAAAPGLLATFSRNAEATRGFGVDDLGAALLSLEPS